MAVYPALSLTDAEVATLVDYTTRIGLSMEMRGLMNIQFVIMGQGTADAETYVIEVNPRASRTIPFISKVTGVPMVKLATLVMLGQSLSEQGYEGGLQPRTPLVGVKAPVFSMSKLGGVDTYLGPEMKSTGEVMGIDTNLQGAMAKALAASDLMLPAKGALLVTVADRDKPEAVPLLKALHERGYDIYATVGTAALISGLGIPVTMVNKAGEPVPNAVSIVEDGTVHGVINTIAEVAAALRDGFAIRRAATERRVPCYTSMDTAKVAIAALSSGSTEFNIATVSDYVKGLA